MLLKIQVQTCTCMKGLLQRSLPQTRFLCTKFSSHTLLSATKRLRRLYWASSSQIERKKNVYELHTSILVDHVKRKPYWNLRQFILFGVHALYKWMEPILQAQRFNKSNTLMLLHIQSQIRNLGCLGCKHIHCILIIKSSMSIGFSFHLTWENVYKMISYTWIFETWFMKLAKPVWIRCLWPYIETPRPWGGVSVLKS